MGFSRSTGGEDWNFVDDVCAWTFAYPSTRQCMLAGNQLLADVILKAYLDVSNGLLVVDE